MASMTTGEFARQHGIPEWRVRRMVDSLPIEVPRVGQYRALTESIQKRLLENLKSEASSR